VLSLEEVITPDHGAAPATTPHARHRGTVTTQSACAPTVTEGDTQLNAALARANYGLDGRSIKVGILSDSYNLDHNTATTASQDIATGDLPGPGNPCGYPTPVQVTAEGPNGADEGRAMLEIVHDLAPAASLAFASALPSDTAFASNIQTLATNGANVIADDFVYYNEPFFQAGPLANAVATVTGNGVNYFTLSHN
jgi:hypothetical protein